MKNDYRIIGQLLKPHGYKGEIVADIDDEQRAAVGQYFFICIDELFVPFFIQTIRPHGAGNFLVKFEDVDNEKQAAQFARRPLYVERTDEDDDEIGLDDLIGFTAVDNFGSILGVIDDIDDSTENVLMIVKRSDGSEVYIPLVDEFITSIDETNRSIFLDLPDGLTDLN